MARYDYYINLEFSYFDKENNHHLMIFGGAVKEYLNGSFCSHCGKPFKTSAYYFQDSETNEEWLFGSECVKNVFGAGLGKYSIKE